MRIKCNGLTDKGDHPKVNQDCILCLKGTIKGHHLGLFIVADGMGGLSYGAKVSRFIVEWFKRWWKVDIPLMIKTGYLQKEDIEELLEQEIWEINQAVLTFSREMNCKVGSTLSLLFLIDGACYIKNLGDSRVYVSRENAFQQLTQDQTYVAKLVKEKKMTAEQAQRSTKRNYLTMCIGVLPVPKAYAYHNRVCKGDVYLLCSDGLYNALQEDEIKKVMANKTLKPKQKVQYLRRQIPVGGATDNISIIVVEIK